MSSRQHGGNGSGIGCRCCRVGSVGCRGSRRRCRRWGRSGQRCSGLLQRLHNGIHGMIQGDAFLRIVKPNPLNERHPVAVRSPANQVGILMLQRQGRGDWHDEIILRIAIQNDHHEPRTALAIAIAGRCRCQKEGSFHVGFGPRRLCKFVQNHVCTAGQNIGNGSIAGTLQHAQVGLFPGLLGDYGARHGFELR